MKSKEAKQMVFEKLVAPYKSYRSLALNKEKTIEIFKVCLNSENIEFLKGKINDMRKAIQSYRNDKEGIRNIDSDGDTVSLRKDILISELNQILEAKTIQRAKYYLKRLKKGIEKVKTNKINDINLHRWKEYDEIITDSLWIMGRRDASGAHIGWYWGNFIPQIPHQMMLRYTKKGDWVLDAFVGSGTTLIECKRMGRNGIGIELNPKVSKEAQKLIKRENNKYNVTTDLITGDSRKVNIKEILDTHKIKKIKLLIMHPPYHDIIKFSQDERDLSNARNTDKFLNMFGDVVDNVTPYLAKGRYFALVIGDKYYKGEWIPLGFYCMKEVLKRGYLLKSIIVKNFEETRGKRNQKALWRYRALVGGFYIFKHEYVMLFKKK
jgi:DNA modification methylase